MSSYFARFALTFVAEKHSKASFPMSCEVFDQEAWRVSVAWHGILAEL
jgi:hypothetical protein